MIKFYNNLYVSDSVKNINKIKWKIRIGRGQLNIFLIIISNSSDQLECIHNALLKQPIYRKLDLKIVGFATSYDESLLLIQKILEDVWKETGNADMKDYLLRHFSYRSNQ